MARRLLLDEAPLILLPSVAVVLGVNEALILQQINYWIQASKNEYDNHFWTFNSYNDWRKQFPFWSKETIGRGIRNLERMGLVISTVGPNKRATDRTKWYRINHDVFEELFPERAKMNDHSAKMNDHDVNLTPSAVASKQLQSPTCQNEPTLPEKTNTKNTTESISSLIKKPRAPKLHSRFIFAEMQKEFGYPEKTDKDPIPNYGREAKAIKRMVERGYLEEDILKAWCAKVRSRGEFVSMTWVNEDIGKNPKQAVFALPNQDNLAAAARERGLIE